MAEALAEPVPSIFADERPPPSTRPQRQGTTRPASIAGPVPALPGVIRARELDADRACINGRIYRRLPNGWDHIGGRCRATSQ